MKKQLLIFILGIITGIVIIGIFIKFSPSLTSFISDKKIVSQPTDCGEESQIQYCLNGNGCITLCNLCSCKTPVCSPNPLCQK